MLRRRRGKSLLVCNVSLDAESQSPGCRAQNDIISKHKVCRSPSLILTFVLNGYKTIRHWPPVFRLLQSQSPGPPTQNSIIHPVSKNEVHKRLISHNTLQRLPNNGAPSADKSKNHWLSMSTPSASESPALHARSPVSPNRLTSMQLMQV